MTDLDPTWPPEQRLEIIARLAEILRNDSGLKHGDTFALADTIHMIALARAARVEASRKMIEKMLKMGEGCE